MSAHANTPSASTSKEKHCIFKQASRIYLLQSRTGKPLTLVNYLQDEGLNWECHKLNFFLFEELSTSHGAQRNFRQQTQFSFHCLLSVL